MPVHPFIRSLASLMLKASIVAAEIDELLILFFKVAE
jgi:hypothetical protein